MKNLKLLSKNYFLVILFSLFFGFATNSQEPVDIWEVGEKKPKENLILTEDELEKNIQEYIDNKIDITTKKGSAYWSNNGGYICKIPSDKKPQNYLVEFAMFPQDECKAFLEQLKKLM